MLHFYRWNFINKQTNEKKVLVSQGRNFKEGLDNVVTSKGFGQLCDGQWSWTGSERRTTKSLDKS